MKLCIKSNKLSSINSKGLISQNSNSKLKSMSSVIGFLHFSTVAYSGLTLRKNPGPDLVASTGISVRSINSCHQ